MEVFMKRILFGLVAILTTLIAQGMEKPLPQPKAYFEALQRESMGEVLWLLKNNKFDEFKAAIAAGHEFPESQIPLLLTLSKDAWRDCGPMLVTQCPLYSGKNKSFEIRPPQSLKDLACGALFAKKYDVLKNGLQKGNTVLPEDIKPHLVSCLRYIQNPTEFKKLTQLIKEYIVLYPNEFSHVGFALASNLKIANASMLVNEMLALMTKSEKNGLIDAFYGGENQIKSLSAACMGYDSDSWG